MSYEDVIRVAQAKIDPVRRARIAAEIGVKPGEPFTVTEFLKPGIDEFCSILPPWPAKRILALAERHGWLGRVYWGMEVNSASVASARAAALVDPEGEGLAKCLGEIESPSARRVAAE